LRNRRYATEIVQKEGLMLELNMSESTHRSMALTSHGTDGRLSIAAPRSDGGAYRNEAMQFLRLRWGKVVEVRLHEDTYKLVNELQERLSQVDQV